MTTDHYILATGIVCYLCQRRGCIKRDPIVCKIWRYSKEPDNGKHVPFQTAVKRGMALTSLDIIYVNETLLLVF